MDEVFHWLTTLPSSDSWSESSPVHSLTLAASGTKSIVLRADRTAGSDTDVLVTFSVLLQGFHHSGPTSTLWLSHPFPLSSPLHPLLLQLLQELVFLAPSSPPLPSPPELDAHVVSAALAVSDEETVPFVGLVFFCRLFWLCARTAPAEAGFLLFQTVDGGGGPYPSVAACKRAVGAFLAAVGPDWEQRFARSTAYVLTKWLILRGLQTGGAPPPAPAQASLSYAVDSHGLWVLKAYVPVQAMHRLGGSASEPVADPKEATIRYALAHQQLEVAVQLEYEICVRDPRFIKIVLRVDNIRIHVVRLGFKEEDHVDLDDGVNHVPTRVRIWVGPALGSSYTTGPSLGRSSENPGREIESVRALKGRVGKTGPELKAKARMIERTRVRRWRWEQEAEGCAGVYEGVLCNERGDVGAGRWGLGGRRGVHMGLVVARDEVGEGVTWRVGREMEGKVVTWRVGLKVWVSYSGADNKKHSFSETRCVECLEEMELALVGC